MKAFTYYLDLFQEENVDEENYREEKKIGPFIAKTHS